MENEGSYAPVENKAYIRSCLYFVAADVDSQLTSLQQISLIFLQFYILTIHNFNMSQFPHNLTQYLIGSTYKGFTVLSQFQRLWSIILLNISFAFEL